MRTTSGFKPIIGEVQAAYKNFPDLEGDMKKLGSKSETVSTPKVSLEDFGKMRHLHKLHIRFKDLEINPVLQEAKFSVNEQFGNYGKFGNHF